MEQAGKEFKKKPKMKEDVKLPTWFNKDNKVSEEITEEEKAELEGLLKEFR